MQSTMAKEIWHHQKPVSPIAKPEYSTIAKAQEKNLKTNFMEMIAGLTE